MYASGSYMHLKRCTIERNAEAGVLAVSGPHVWLDQCTLRRNRGADVQTTSAADFVYASRAGSLSLADGSNAPVQEPPSNTSRWLMADGPAFERLQQVRSWQIARLHLACRPDPVSHAIPKRHHFVPHTSLSMRYWQDVPDSDLYACI